MNERRKMLAVENTVDTVVLRVTTTDGSTNVGIEMVVTNGDTVYPVTTDSQGKVSLTGLSGGCTIDCETHELNVTEFYATGSMTVDISAWVNTFPVGEVRNYNYTGGVQQVDLIPGTYVLQVWGAQGGDNAAASSYGITAKAGGKGGYSEGVITLSIVTKIRVYVGGAGSSSVGGFNGGGTTTGSASYNSGDEQGVSRMGGGGGATDIRLSNGALLSRMIVAGGGGGGAMCYKKVTETVETEESVPNSWIAGSFNYNKNPVVYYPTATTFATITIDISNVKTINLQSGGNFVFYAGYLQNSSQSDNQSDIYKLPNIDGSYSLNIASYYASAQAAGKSPYYLKVSVRNTSSSAFSNYGDINLTKKISTSSTVSTNSSQVGYVGGGTNGGGYSSSYYGKQNGAGNRGSFGQGANQTITNYRYCSGAGGGGWYGGGMGYSDSDMNSCKMSGGGSGFVNIAANAQYRPSGYTGLQLDSGTTYAGNQSFPNTAGNGNETGHSGNGYAKIMRIAVLNITLRFKNEDNEPVVNTSVTLASGSDTHTSTTDASGEATFTVQNGTYNVSCVGYALTPSQITVTKNQTFDFVAELPSIREYAYTGSVQQDTLPAGTYKIECWGAQGGYRSNTSYGGKGGYSTGILNLTQTTTIYVYVGGSGNTGGTYGGFNGGGRRHSYVGGGGASDVRISQDSLYARVIVAGGGGSDGATSKGGGAGGGTNGQNTTASNYGNGGYGGGASASSPNTGGTSYFAGINATQPTSNSPTTQAETHNGFGWGGSGSYYSNGYGGAGGGGWFGGVGTYPDGSGDDDKGGGGGSGYVYTSGTAGNYPSGCLLNSSHYLTDAETKAGNVSFPSTSGGTETGHSGNGYIRITKV